MRRTLLLVGAIALAGAALTTVAGLATGMPAADVSDMAIVMGVAVAATVGGTAGALRLLRAAPFGRRLAAAVLAGIAVSLLNLVVFALLMFVSGHDATLMFVLLAYAAAVGVAVGLALARPQAEAVIRLTQVAHAIAEGDLGARVGAVPGGPELQTLAGSLDEMAERVQAALEREREAERTRRDLVTAVSHDLRTPLSAMRAMIEAIDDGVVDDVPTLRRYAGELRTSVGVLSTLVDDLFELAQLDAEAIRSETRRARVGDVIRDALLACEIQARNKGLVVETRLDGTDGALCSPRLVRVVQNLLQNAIRHTPSDGTVWVEATRRPGSLEVAVADTGEGIRADDLERVFEPFWRGDPARSTSGSGLGLALARRIVDAMGGEIRVESEPDRGSRFAVLLPVRGEVEALSAPSG